ncbi:MAG: IS481 family transposase [Gemmatimonadaceae bacterium]
MNVHKNARCTPRGRSLAVARVAAGEPRAVVARGCGITPRTLKKWEDRAHAAGVVSPEVLADRSSRPRRLARQLPRHQRRQILRSRHKRWSSLRIAQHYTLKVSTVVSFLRRHGLNRLTRLEPVRPIQRYERRRPGTLVHLDVKKLGKIGRVGHRMHGDRTTRVRGIGWEYVHVAIDDCTRVGYAEVLADEQAETTVGFLARVVAWYAAHGITVRRLLTDNGGNYRSTALAACCRRFRIRHYFTRPYRPQTNGKAERFIRTLLHEWAYAQAYGRSSYRTRALATYLRFYNAERRHTALKFLTPLQRLATKQ